MIAVNSYQRVVRIVYISCWAVIWRAWRQSRGMKLRYRVREMIEAYTIHRFRLEFCYYCGRFTRINHDFCHKCQSYKTT